MKPHAEATQNELRRGVQVKRPRVSEKRTPLEQLHAKAKREKPQRALLFQLAAAKIQAIPEYPFHSTRKWRLDVVIAGAEPLLAVEIDGGGFIQGRHSRGLGIENDCEKFAAAMLAGWRILRVTPKHIRSGEALTWITELLQ